MMCYNTWTYIVTIKITIQWWVDIIWENIFGRRFICIKVVDTLYRSWMVPTTIDSTETLQDINEERCIRRTYRIRLAKVNCGMLTSQRGDAPNKKNHVIIVKRHATNILPETIHLLFTTIAHIWLAQTLKPTENIKCYKCFISRYTVWYEIVVFPVIILYIKKFCIIHLYWDIIVTSKVYVCAGVYFTFVFCTQILANSIIQYFHKLDIN